MIRLPLRAPTRFFPPSLTVLAALVILGLTSHAAVQVADPGYVTAKTWVDPANRHAAAGDGRADDWQNLQDMIHYAVAHNEAIQLEPGTYKISKTLMIPNPPHDYYYGFRMSGIGGPNAVNTTYYNSGVSLALVTSDARQLAVLEVGEGNFYDMTIENIGLETSVNGKPNSVATKYGLLFAGQNFSHAKIDMVTVASVDTAFAIDVVPGVKSGGNGENVTIDNCLAKDVNCFYYNNSPAGQALCHSISQCGWTINNGGTAIKIGQPGEGLDATSFSGTFYKGPKRNTLIECFSPPTYVNVTGGRIENCDTLLRYVGDSPATIGHVNIRGMDFDAFGVDGITYPGYSLLDDTLNGRDAQQFTNTFEQCRFNGSYNGKFPSLKLTSFPSGGDHSKNYFDRCTFTGFSNSLTDASNRTDLSHLGAVVRDCRSAIGTTGGSYFNDISYP